MKSRMDFHMHSSCSDGTDRPEALAEKARAAGLEFFALTDHDTVMGCRLLLRQTPCSDGFFPGVEFSSQTAVRKCHILGYDFDPEHSAIAELVSQAGALRRQKTDLRIAFVRDSLGIEFNSDELEWLYALPAAGKPHIATLLVKRGLAPDVGTGIEKFLKNMQIPDVRLDAKQVTDGIRAAGGVAVWAHPLGGEGVPHLSEEEFFRQFHALLRCGIQGLECYYSRYTKEECAFLAATAKTNGLLISCGSDYHGMNKNIQIGESNRDGFSVDRADITLPDALLLRRKEKADRKK